jgi:hypothetical protein
MYVQLTPVNTASYKVESYNAKWNGRRVGCCAYMLSIGLSSLLVSYNDSPESYRVRMCNTITPAQNERRRCVEKKEALASWLHSPTYKGTILKSLSFVKKAILSKNEYVSTIFIVFI